ncbi:hypothetical protein ACRAWG_15505 [Methylobacterium sp. P31]
MEAGRDLHLQGTPVTVGGWIDLDAGRDVLIESARARGLVAIVVRVERRGRGRGAGGYPGGECRGDGGGLSLAVPRPGASRRPTRTRT